MGFDDFLPLRVEHHTENDKLPLCTMNSLSLGHVFFLGHQFLMIWGSAEADFSSLDGILELFKNSTPESAAAGWIHYLAFDFWMGAWILQNAQKRKISHIVIIIPLTCTFMLGPFGVLLYAIFSKVSLKFKKQ